MPKLELTAPVEVATSPERAFDYFTDYHNVAHVLKGVNRWEPIGSRTQGVGARYEVEMSALGFPIRSVLRLNRWRRPHEIGWVSESGLIKQQGGFTFTPIAEGVRIELRIEYVPPASILGVAVEKRFDGLIRGRLHAAMQGIKSALES